MINAIKLALLNHKIAQFNMLNFCFLKLFLELVNYAYNEFLALLGITCHVFIYTNILGDFWYGFSVMSV